VNKTILVVDDEPDVQNLAKMILERAGYQIITASNGVEGEETAKAKTPDLILLDVIMPGKNGYEVCKALRGEPKTVHIPIIIFSASGSRSTRDAALEAGANDFLQKPFTIKALTEIVEKNLRGEGTTTPSSESKESS